MNKKSELINNRLKTEWVGVQISKEEIINNKIVKLNCKCDNSKFRDDIHMMGCINDSINALKRYTPTIMYKLNIRAIFDNGSFTYFKIIGIEV